jgi:epoxide hydrolase-like predicted phosphatase
MDIRAVIVDFGGVLVRTDDPAPRDQLAARLGLAPADLSRLVFDCDAAVQATVGRLPEAALWQHVQGQLGLSDDEVQVCRREFFAGDRLDTGLVRLLQSLRPRYKTAILSNAWSTARDAFTRLFGLDHAVDQIIISAEEGLAKPDPRLYQLAVDRLGVRPQAAVFVDDFSANVEAARAVGLHAIHYTPGLDVRAALAELGVQP